MFIVSAQTPLTTGGGYVAGFVADPDDESVSISQLSATRGSVTAKWYESTRITVPLTNMMYFTHQGLDSRFTSPGRFWLLSDGKPSVDLNVVITVKWKVQLLQASLGDDVSFNLSTNIYPKKDNWNLQWKGKSATGADEMKDDFSLLAEFANVAKGSKGYYFFRTPTFNIEYSEGTGDTGTVQMHFVVYNVSDKRLYFSDDDATVNTTKWQSNLDTQVLLPKGTLIRLSRYVESLGASFQEGRRHLVSSPSKNLTSSSNTPDSHLENLLHSIESLVNGNQMLMRQLRNLSVTRHPDMGRSQSLPRLDQSWEAIQQTDE